MRYAPPSQSAFWPRPPHLLVFYLTAPSPNIREAGPDATVERENRTAGAGNPHQMRHIAADAGDTRHFGDTAPVEPDCQMIGHLRRAKW